MTRTGLQLKITIASNSYKLRLQYQLSTIKKNHAKRETTKSLKSEEEKITISCKKF